MDSTTGLVRSTIAAALRPDPVLTVSQWADEHRQLSAEASSEPGQWRTSRAPYLREIMDRLSPSDPTQSITVMKGARLGLSEAGNNWLGFIMHHAPGPILMVYPTFDIAKRVSKVRINHMINSSPVLRDRVAEARSRDASNTILYKEFQGGQLVMIGAKSANSMRELTVRYIYADEIDGYDPEILREGNTLSLIERRADTFTYKRKVFKPSTPTEEGNSIIKGEYLRGDQRRYFIPCPACGHMDYLTWQGRDWLRDEAGATHHSIGYDNDDQSTAHMVCSGCFERVAEGWKTWMLERGEWRPTAEATEPYTVSYHISSLYAPTGFDSWARAVGAWLEAQKDESKLRVFVNQTLGETYEDRSEGAPKAEGLCARKRVYPAEVPNGVGILVASMDVHKDRLEVQVEGFGAGEENWVIEWQAFYGDPLKRQVWLDADALLRRRFTWESGQQHRIERVAVDAKYLSDEVYRFTKARQGRGVYAVAGISQVDKPIVGRASKKGNKYNATTFPLCTSVAKDRIMARLRIQAPGPGYMHFPEDLDAEWFEQLTAERKIRKKVGRRIVMEWEKQRERNEALDLKVMNLAALYIAGPELIAGLAKRAATRAVKVDPPTSEDATMPRQQRQPRFRKGRGWVSSVRR